MPLIEITLVEGRTPKILRDLISRVTSAVAESTGAQMQSIRVIVREVPSTHWAAGDTTIQEREI